MPTEPILYAGRFLLQSLLLFALCVPALAQDDSQLVGRELERQVDGGDALADQLLGALGQIDAPSIETLTISDATPEALTLSMHVTGLEQLGLVARLLRENGQIETRIDDVAVGPSASAEPLRELRFVLPERVSEGTEFETHFVSFQLQRFGRVLPGLEWRYPLIKQWNRAVAPENLVITIEPEPIGQAARLPMVLERARPLPKPPQLQVSPELLQPIYRLDRLEQIRPASRPTDASTAAQPVPRVSAAASPRVSTAAIASAARSAKSTERDRSVAVAPMYRIDPAMLARMADRASVSNLQLTDQQRRVLLDTNAVRARLPQLTLENVSGLKQEDRDRGARGPSEQTIDLLSIIRADADIPVNELLGIHRYLHLDRNPASGVLYYVPRDFNLRWTPDNGFGFDMLYAAVEEGAAGQVLMALRLESGVRANDNPLIRQLADAYRQLRQSGLKVEVVRPLPVTSQHPAVNLADSLGAHFDIPTDDLVATVFSDVLAEIEVSWVTDEITKQNIELVLGRGQGLGGDVTFTLDSEPPSQISIPARVRLADQATFGRIPWQRENEWRNRTPYPLRLKRLHALIFEDDTPIVYSWQLGDAEVPPEARVAWDASGIPGWLDQRASRMWVEYAVVEDCAECTRSVMQDITYGAGRARSRENVRIVSLTPLADLGAIELSVRLRSRYFDSEGSELLTGSAVVVDADRGEFDGGRVYLVDRQPGEERPGDPLYEYQVEVVMPDGTIHRPPADRWIASDRSRLLIGTVQIEQSLGYLPGRDDDE